MNRSQKNSTYTLAKRSPRSDFTSGNAKLEQWSWVGSLTLEAQGEWLISNGFRSTKSTRTFLEFGTGAELSGLPFPMQPRLRPHGLPVTSLTSLHSKKINCLFDSLPLFDCFHVTKEV